MEVGDIEERFLQNRREPVKKVENKKVVGHSVEKRITKIQKQKAKGCQDNSLYERTQVP